MKHSVTYWVMLALVATTTIGLVGCQSLSPAQPEEDVPSAVVARDDLVVAISASGRIEPVSRVDLMFEGTGRVAEVNIEVGDTVQAGDLLAQLESEQLALQVEQAQAAIESAQARLAQLRAGAREAELAAKMASVDGAKAQVEVSRANLDQLLTGASAAQIAAAESELASAQAQRRTAEDFHDKTMTCKTIKLPTGEKTTICPALGPVEEQARFNLAAADSALAAAEARLNELLSGADADAARAAQANVAVVEAQVDAAQAQVDMLLAGATEGELAAAEAQVNQAEVALDQAKLSLEKAALRSSLDGTVAAVNVVAGEAPPVGRPAITIIDISSMRVTIAVDELDVGRLEAHQPAVVTLDALPGEIIPGTVRRIAPAAMLDSGVVSYDAVVDLAPTDVPLRVDMTANVTVIVEEISDVLVIPTWVVRVDRSTNQTYVDRKRGDTIERVDVELGVRREGIAEVLDGLDEGDVVVRVPESGAFAFELGQ